MAYNERKMLEDVNGDLIPQYYDPVEDVFKPLTNDPRDVRLTGSYPEYRIVSDEDFPEAKENEKGAILIVMDTGDIYMNHGGTWGDF